MTYRDAVNAALEDEMASDERSTSWARTSRTLAASSRRRGHAEKFPGRVKNTPICENGFVGVAIGMAVTGLRPVVEIMFSDFLPTAGDAIVKELPKFRFMSGGQCEVPVTIRSIGGGTGRFGTQHSATGESWFLELPGLSSPPPGRPGRVLGAARGDSEPQPRAVLRAQGPLRAKGRARRAASRSSARPRSCAKERT